MKTYWRCKRTGWRERRTGKEENEPIYVEIFTCTVLMDQRTAGDLPSRAKNRDTKSFLALLRIEMHIGESRRTRPHFFFAAHNYSAFTK